MSLTIPLQVTLSEEALDQIADALDRRRTARASAEAGSAALSDLRATLGTVEQPSAWRLVEERTGETYTWGQGRDVYDPFRVYEGVTSLGTIRLAVGECSRPAIRGRDRRYFTTFYVTPRGSKKPISEFLETDDHASSGQLVAIIKGRDGGAKMYDPGDPLPIDYKAFRVETYRDRVNFPGAYRKLGVVAHEFDVATMLGHTLIQAQTRFGYKQR
ncbi:MAG: hypothetical protein QOE08_1533 [Thermoleophilaceae bacterium]|nr:hypothetical protein [Thermoleophilaceae bacterium]